MKTPFPALLITPPRIGASPLARGCIFRPVEVLEIAKASESVRIRIREGGCDLETWAPMAHLATSVERAAEIAAPFLSALLGKEAPKNSSSRRPAEAGAGVSEKP